MKIFEANNGPSDSDNFKASLDPKMGAKASMPGK